MERLFTDLATWGEPWTGFGHSQYAPHQVPMHQLAVAASRRTVRRALREHCPLSAGVYGMLDQAGQLIYVGMSAQLRNRLLSYFTRSGDTGKQHRIAEQAEQVVWETSRHELLAQLRELELIQRWRPRFNARGRPGRNELGYIYLAGGAAPTFRTGARLPGGCCHHWGPLPLSRRVRAAVNRLNHVFQLRDCAVRTPVRFADQPTLFASVGRPDCLRGQLQTCLAPCAGRGTQADYSLQVRAARALLDGRDSAMLDQLETSMHAAAEAQQYEQAAVYRDTWQQLALLCQRLELINHAQKTYWFVYPFRDRRRKAWWMLVTGGTVARVVARPHTPSAADRCGKLLAELFSVQNVTAPQDSAALRLVASWFRHHPEERDRALPPDKAIALCRETCAAE